MMLSPHKLDRIAAVSLAETTSFVELVRIAQLDPVRAFRGADLRGVDFGDDDIAGFDFTGADLRGADISRARNLSAAIFRNVQSDTTTRGFMRLRKPQRDTLRPFWAAGRTPSWAEDWGHDEYGPWVIFRVPGTEVTQRMRWIPSGKFIMGSPGDEVGRWDAEGPQHEVSIADGFWLFDTACTQALWQAVMGVNPSYFQSPTRPVEQITFGDTQAFVDKLSALNPGLNLELPSEARWEYACRASTTEATYIGVVQTLGDYNAPMLDAIAWYGGNSGIGFDLDNGYDSSNWQGKQYQHTRAGTHPVGQKAPNQWGLYDMIGNVWEWCEDYWHHSYEGAPDDGSAWVGHHRAADHVIRGGSWLSDARRVRAAYRTDRTSTVRGGDLGFRCALVHSPSKAP